MPFPRAKKPSFHTEILKNPHLNSQRTMFWQSDRKQNDKPAQLIQGYVTVNGGHMDNRPTYRVCN